MQRYFIKFAYLGSTYRGIQVNRLNRADYVIYDPDTVQGSLENAFLLLEPNILSRPTLKLSSRTDSGVHALCNAAHIDIIRRGNFIYSPEIALATVNRYLTTGRHEIRLLEFIPVKQTFHSRLFARSRTYLYRLIVPKNYNDLRIPIIEQGRSFLIRNPNFDVDRIRNAMQIFKGWKNFMTYSAVPKTNWPIRYVRKLDIFTIEKGRSLMPYDLLSENFEYWDIICKSKSFLYHQVRRMVAGLLALGTGKLTEKDLTVMLQVPGHHNWPCNLTLVPPHGLYLSQVEYDQEELDEQTIKFEPDSSDSERAIPVAENEV